MLAHTNDAIAAEVLAFLSVFLYDGNRDVQVCTLRSMHVADVQTCIFQFVINLHFINIYVCIVSF